jgi:hypothetical protein
VYWAGGILAPKKSEREEYLEKAIWAEEMAAQFADGFYKTSWLNIAEGYRDMIKKLDQADEAGSQKQ